MLGIVATLPSRTFPSGTKNAFVTLEPSVDSILARTGVRKSVNSHSALSLSQKYHVSSFRSYTTRKRVLSVNKPDNGTKSPHVAKTAPRKASANPEALLSSKKAKILRAEADAITKTDISSAGGIRSVQVAISLDKVQAIHSEIQSRRPPSRREKTVINHHLLPTVIIEGLNDKYGAHRLPVNAGIRPSNATDSDQVRRAHILAKQLNIPYFETINQIKRAGNVDFALIVGTNHISLANMEELNSPAVFSDFISGATAHRLEYVFFHCFCQVSFIFTNHTI